MKRAVVPAIDPEWNERQRRVLDLLARGATNPEIAAALGITLDGAKWHVSDILSRLGVDAREEAAEYWRARNGLGSRLRRFARGALPASAVGRWLAGGGSAAVIAVGVAVLVVVLVSQGGEDEPGTASPTETATPVATAVPTPQAGLSAPAPSVIAGKAVQPLRLEFPVELPSNLAVYYYRAPYAKDGPFINLFRTYAAGGNRPVEEDLLRGLPDQGLAFDMAFDPETERIAVLICRKGFCGGYGQPEPSSEPFLHTSDDGGVTWEERGRLPTFTFAVAWTGDGLVLSTASDESLREGRLWLFPSGQEVKAPRDGYLSYVTGLGMVSWTDDGTVRDAGGNVIFKWNDPTIALRGGVVTSWATPLSTKTGYERDQGDQPPTYLLDFDSGQALQRVYSWSGPVIDPVVRMSDNLILGNALTDPDRFGHFPAVIIWLSDASIHELRFPAVQGSVNPVIIGAREGLFVRVTGAGDCLNVREGPATSAAILSCYRDNVILRLRDNVPVEAGGISWLPVATPDGRPGWASAEFLER